jgi:hypothetical protein
MTILTPAALLAIANLCLPPRMVPVILDVILPGEGGFVTNAVHHNLNGTTDYGLGQINETNFAWLSVVLHTPVNAQSVLEPCLNLKASAAVLFKRYNGSGPAAERYGANAWQRLLQGGSESALAVPARPPPPPPCALAWDAWALAACSSRQATQPPKLLQQESSLER